ncbi:MAG: LysR substrate-binding domain-containing protein [Polyangiaceae bacterium]
MYGVPPKVTLRQMQYLLAVAEFGSFRRAAAACRVAQPSLSAQVAEVETAVGVRLFERDQRHVHVTEAGRDFIERSRRVLVEVGDLLEAVQRFRDPLTGQLRIGIIPTIGPYLLPKIVPILRRKYPELMIGWLEDKTATLVHLLHNGQMDGAILALPSEVGELRTIQLFNDPFYLAVPHSHRLAKMKRAIRLEHLEDEPWLLLDEGHCLREQALSACASVRTSELGFRATSLSTLVQMVSAGTGITLLPKLTLETETRRAEIATLPIVGAHPTRAIAIAFRAGCFREPALQAIGQLLTEAARSIVGVRREVIADARHKRQGDNP